jgi:hypothetical protein
MATSTAFRQRLTSGTRDLTLSDTVRVHRKLRQAGVEAYLQVFEGMSHGQYLSAPSTPEVKEAFAEIAAFIDAHLVLLCHKNSLVRFDSCCVRMEILARGGGVWVSNPTDTAADHDSRPMLRLLYAGALRISELCALTWRDLQPRDDAGQVTVCSHPGRPDRVDGAPRQCR